MSAPAFSPIEKKDFSEKNMSNPTIKAAEAELEEIWAFLTLN